MPAIHSPRPWPKEPCVHTCQILPGGSKQLVGLSPPQRWVRERERERERERVRERERDEEDERERMREGTRKEAKEDISSNKGTGIFVRKYMYNMLWAQANSISSALTSIMSSLVSGSITL